ncbi:MAG: NAD(P)/FAD-dependent oxidoreductase [Smithellaceae bacterium]
MKIAVIGGGPGGLYAALTAANYGGKVDLFEKRRIGEGIVCGECIFDSLRVIDRPGRGLLRPVDEIILQGRQPYPFALSRHRPLWMLDRKTWQQDLAAKARRKGVAIHENENITPSRLRRMIQDYDWVIDASGAPSVTSRLYRFTADYTKEFLAAYQVVLRGDFGALWPRIKVAFFPDLPAFCQPAYYWIFPKDTQTANVGVVCTAKRHLDKSKANLKSMLSDVLHREGLNGMAVLEKGGGIATGRVLPKLVYDNILLAGDAAGLTSALHGGGIDLACLSGVAAAVAVREGKDGVQGYERKLKDYVRERNALEAVTIRKMRTMNFEQFDRLLAGVTAKSRFTRLKTGLRHLDMLYTTLKWFGTKKEIPDWPV